jgi:hypothetical protein
MAAIYLSCSTEDTPLASKLMKALSGAGFHIVQSGIQNETDLFSKNYDQALKSYDILLLLWSKAARKCRTVERDWTNALVFDKKIVSLVLDNAAIPAALLKGILLDFRGMRRSWSHLLESLQNGSVAKVAKSNTIDDGIHNRASSKKEHHSRAREDAKTSESERIKFRSRPHANFSIDNVEKMLGKWNFFDKTWQCRGKGISHQYEMMTQFGDNLMIDHKTGLVWQQGGSNNWMVYSDTPKYIAALNASYFGGFTDWRLPTLEETMSLVEPLPSENNMHISACFSPEQRYIWTADKQNEDIVWFVAFPNGGIGSCRVRNYNSVRAVRTKK